MRPEMNGTRNTPPEILAPVNTLDEVGPLLEAGADWLYGGVLPREWRNRYPSTVLLNQRTFASAQFSSMSELAAAVKRTRDAAGFFALTLNAPFYMDEQIPPVLDIVRWAAGNGVSAIIAADPGLMTRVILPRSLTTEQIASLIRQAPEVEYEAFILVGRCPNIEGLCTFEHDSPSGRWPCEWEWTLSKEGGGLPPEPVMAHFDGIKAAGRRQGCGLCALLVLTAAGVGAFKIVGRGASSSRKVGLVRQVKRLIKLADGEPDDGWVEECLWAYKQMFGHPCSIHDCYYPEFREGA